MLSERSVASGPLVGLRVLDIGQLVAGPVTGTILADWGADVVKIEQPGVGDPIRQLGPSGDDASLWWKVNGRNKRSVALDLRNESDRDTLLQLIPSADVLIENFTPGTMERWGLSYSDLSQLNQGLVMLRISAYGQTGPNRAKRGFGRSAEAYSGLSYITGFADRPPVHPGIPLGDFLAGLTGVGSVLAALRARDHSGGNGQEIDLALYEAAFRLMELVASSYGHSGSVTERQGTGNTYVAPVGTWQSADGKWVSLTASTEPVVRRLFSAMGRADLAEDPRFIDNDARVARQQELDIIMSDWVASQTAGAISSSCDAEGVPYCIEYSIADIFDDPHYRERQSIAFVADGPDRQIAMPGVVPRFAATPGAIRWLGEELGASNAEVLEDESWGAIARVAAVNVRQDSDVDDCR